MHAVLMRILYWIAVLAISRALLVALVLFLESRDESSLESGWKGIEKTAAATPS